MTERHKTEQATTPDVRDIKECGNYDYVLCGVLRNSTFVFNMFDISEFRIVKFYEG